MLMYSSVGDDESEPLFHFITAGIRLPRKSWGECLGVGASDVRAPALGVQRWAFSVSGIAGMGVFRRVFVRAGPYSSTLCAGSLSIAGTTVAAGSTLPAFGRRP